MIMKLVAFTILSTFMINGQESSTAVGAQSIADAQPITVRSDSGQGHPLALRVGFRTPADVRHAQRNNQAGSYSHKIHGDDAMSHNGEIGQSQALDGDKEKERLDQLQEQLTAKEKELATLRETTTAAAKLLNVEKTRAESLEAQLTQKEQELSVLCTQRDTHQDMSQELNRTKSGLEQAKEQVTDMERQFAVNNGYIHQAVRRIAELDHELVVKEHDLKLAKSNVDKMTLMLVDLDKELNDRSSELTQAKQLLARLGRTLPKQAKSAPVTAALPNGDVTKVSENLMGALQDELKRGSVALRQRGSKVTLALASGELFAKGQATMTPTGTSLVERIGTALHKVPYQSIEVAGHTDNTPVKYSNRRPFRDNHELSRARAEHAGKALVGSGLGADRVKAVGYAATRPIATNNTEEGRSKNRRVEIVVTPSSGPIASVGEKIEQLGNATRVASQQKGIIQKVVSR
jgi:flagellar motor protein MotB